jgi:hypothetical protein
MRWSAFHLLGLLSCSKSPFHRINVDGDPPSACGVEEVLDKVELTSSWCIPLVMVPGARPSAPHA